MTDMQPSMLIQIYSNKLNDNLMAIFIDYSYISSSVYTTRASEVTPFYP